MWNPYIEIAVLFVCGFFPWKNLLLIRSPSLLNFFAPSARILIPCDIRINCCRQLWCHKVSGRRNMETHRSAQTNFLTKKRLLGFCFHFKTRNSFCLRLSWQGNNWVGPNSPSAVMKRLLQSVIPAWAGESCSSGPCHCRAKSELQPWKIW